MNQRKSLDQWRTILADYERSNHTQAEFCRRRGIALSSFQYHRHRQGDHGAPPQRLIEIRPAASALAEPLREAAAPATDDTELRIEVPLSASRAVTLHCTLAQLPEVIAQLSLSSHHPDR